MLLLNCQCWFKYSSRCKCPWWAALTLVLNIIHITLLIPVNLSNILINPLKLLMCVRNAIFFEWKVSKHSQIVMISENRHSVMFQVELMVWIWVMLFNKIISFLIQWLRKFKLTDGIYWNIVFYRPHHEFQFRASHYKPSVKSNYKCKFH